jgi:hypothetical protein
MGAPGISLASVLITTVIMLQAELDGYTQYVQQVRYRLLPAIW